MLFSSMFQELEFKRITIVLVVLILCFGTLPSTCINSAAIGIKIIRKFIIQTYLLRRSDYLESIQKLSFVSYFNSTNKPSQVTIRRYTYQHSSERNHVVVTCETHHWISTPYSPMVIICFTKLRGRHLTSDVPPIIERWGVHVECICNMLP